MNNNMKFIKISISGILTLAWTGIIFSFSRQPATKSNRVSGGLLKRILDIFYDFTGILVDQSKFINLFRKFAHYTEFFILGIFAVLFFIILKDDNAKKDDVKPYLFAMGYAVLIAVCDETVQFFTGAGRAMRVTDMLIDSFGAFTSLLIIWAINNRRAGKRAL